MAVYDYKSDKRDKELSIADFQSALTVQEVVKLMGVTEQTVKNWCTNGELPHYFIGRRFFIRQSDLEQFAKNSYRKYGAVE